MRAKQVKKKEDKEEYFQFTIALPSSSYFQLKTLAKEADKSMAAVCRTILLRELKGVRINKEVRNVIKANKVAASKEANA